MYRYRYCFIAGKKVDLRNLSTISMIHVPEENVNIPPLSSLSCVCVCVQKCRALAQPNSRSHNTPCMQGSNSAGGLLPSTPGPGGGNSG